MIGHLTTHTVTRYAATSRNINGDQTLGAAETVACRLVRNAALVADQTGDALVSTWRIATETEIKYPDRLDIEGKTYRPINIRRADTFDGRGPLYIVAV